MGIANLEVSYSYESGLLSFTQRITEENETIQRDERFPSWPWVDMVNALGFFGDVINLVYSEVGEFIDVRPAPRTITLKFRRGASLPPTEHHLRCANAWVKLEKNIQAGTLTMEFHRVPGTYKDFVLLDALDHLEGRAGRGKNRYVDGRPSVLRQKREHASRNGPHILYDPAIRPAPIPNDQRVRTDED